MLYLIILCWGCSNTDYLFNNFVLINNNIRDESRAGKHVGGVEDCLAANKCAVINTHISRAASRCRILSSRLNTSNIIERSWSVRFSSTWFVCTARSGPRMFRASSLMLMLLLVKFWFVKFSPVALIVLFCTSMFRCEVDEVLGVRGNRARCWLDILRTLSYRPFCRSALTKICEGEREKKLYP